MRAVKDDVEWKLYFPATRHEIDGNEYEIIMRPWPYTSDYTTNQQGLVACRVYNSMPAKRLWNLIMNSTYDYAEPGFVLIDRINDMNNNWFCENIRATNPCGEQPLPPYGACLLGSVNLTKFVEDPFTDDARFDWEKYHWVVAIFCRMLDNVVEINGLPLDKQSEEILSKRRHGMGFLGLGSTLTMLKMKYGDEDSLAFTERVAMTMATVGWKVGIELADEKGVAPVLEQDHLVTNEMLVKRPEMKVAGYALGDTVKGRVLMGKYSRYMQQFPQQLQDAIAEKGCRYTHHTSIAPTGTISLSLGNNVSNGIEPTFAHSYSRNIIREGKKSKQQVDVLSYELLAYRHLINPQAAAYSGVASADEVGESTADNTNALPDYFVTTDDITPKQHVDVQAAAQKWIDSSISKTANVPTDCAFADFQDIYQYAWKKDSKAAPHFVLTPKCFRACW